MDLNITIINPTEVVFKGEAKSVILPGELGVFEVLPYHKSFMTRLLKGQVEVDGRTFEIERGAVKVENNNVVVVLE